MPTHKLLNNQITQFFRNDNNRYLRPHVAPATTLAFHVRFVARCTLSINDFSDYKDKYHAEHVC